jgi:plastocyanin
MTVSKPSWRVAIRKGDVLSTNATYDTTRASWYESMGIMVVGITDGPQGGVDPFAEPADTRGVLSHGRLPENIEPEAVGEPNPGLANPIRLRRGPYVDRVEIRNFAFGQGDLSRRGTAGRPASVRQGEQLTFVNSDSPLAYRFHTITACKAPCNRTGGIRYPLADGPTVFDSGQLGFGPVMNTSGIFQGGAQGTPITAVTGPIVNRARCAKTGGVLDLVGTGCMGRTTWKTPRTLTPGTYAYFCRIHPFMRGAFRVTPKQR